MTTLQLTGYVKPAGEVVKVLYRIDTKSGACRLRVRHSGAEGQFFEDETAFLENEPDLVSKLKSGRVIRF